ncbi:MAG: hypothetical protein ACE366_29160 [Bradymonadia bacterium]
MRRAAGSHRRAVTTNSLILCLSTALGGCLGGVVDLTGDAGEMLPGGDGGLQPDGDIEPQHDGDLADADLEPADAEPMLDPDGAVDGGLVDVGPGPDEGLEPDVEVPDEGVPDLDLPPDLGPPPTALLVETFQANVQVPLNIHICIDCHRAPGGGGGFGLFADPAPGSPELQANYDAVVQLCDPENPEGSPFYQRALTRHFGSDPFTPEEGAVLRAWISGD